MDDKVREDHQKIIKPISIKGSVRHTESGSLTPVKPHMKNMLVNVDEPHNKLQLSTRIVLDRQTAEGYVSKSQFKGDAYHTLPSDRASGIKENGFELPKKSGFGRDWGDGIYLSGNTEVADHYNSVIGGQYNHKGRDAEELVVKLDTKKPLNVDVNDMPSECNSNSQKRFEWMSSLMQNDHPDVNVKNIFDNEVSKVRNKESQVLSKAAKLYPSKIGMTSEERDATIANRIDWMKQQGYGGGYEPYAAAFTGTAKKLGYDAVIVSEGKQPNQIVSFKPNKIRVINERRVPNKIANHEKIKLTKKS